MSVVWPASLQQKLSTTGFTLSFGDSTLRSEMDIGPAKLRRRSSREIDGLTCSILIDFDEYQDFENFIKITTNGGVTPFEFLNPMTGVNTLYRFVGKPSITPLGGRVFSVSMQWEDLGDA